MSRATGSNLSPVTPEALRRAAAKFATGITVVTTVTPNGRPHGLTVNSFTSVSLNPPIISVCIDLSSSVLPALTSASHFAVNVLSASQQEISARFASTCDARFDGIEWRAGASGAPLLADVIATLECRHHSSIEVGDHVVLFGAVESTERFSGEPLLYFNSQYGRMAE